MTEPLTGRTRYCRVYGDIIKAVDGGWLLAEEVETRLRELTQRAEQAEAERDRLREGLRALVDRFKGYRDAPMLRGNKVEIATIRKSLNVVVAELEELLAKGAALQGPTQPKFPPIQLQDGKSPEWTCQTCGGDLLFCKCPKGEGREDGPRTAAAPNLSVDLSDALHVVFTQHGINSRTQTALVTDVVHWAAQAWRQTPQPAAPDLRTLPEWTALVEALNDPECSSVRVFLAVKALVRAAQPEIS